MNIEYKILRLKKERTILVPIINEKNGETFALFLDYDVRTFEKELKEGINSVTTGKKTEFSFEGNFCRLFIQGNNATIYDALPLSDEEYYESCFKTTTIELKKVIDEWCDKLSEIV